MYGGRRPHQTGLLPRAAQLALLATMIAVSACGIGPAVDCVWSGTAAAWVDADADGVRDPGEAPIPSVRFHADDTLNGFRNAAGTIETDWQGEAGMYVWMPGCPEAYFEIYPEAPAGYRLTTAPVLGASHRDTDRIFEFGFTYLPGVPTATPRPPGPRCTAHNIGTNNVHDVSDVAVAPDGSVWAATFGNGVARLGPERAEWRWYHTADGLADEHVRALTVAPDGSIWFATTNGATHYDGIRWTTYRQTDGLVGDNVYKIAVDGADVVWLATQHGASRFDLRAGRWTSYTEADGLPDDFISTVAVTPDGSVWLPTLLGGIARLLPASEPSGPPRWITYTAHIGPTRVPFDGARDITIAPDGTYWFAGFGGLMAFDPPSSTWTQYSGSLYYNAVEAAPDGAVWVTGGAETTELYRLVLHPAGPARAFWQTFDSRHGLPASPPRTGARALALASSTEVWIATSETVAQCFFVNP